MFLYGSLLFNYLRVASFCFRIEAFWRVSGIKKINLFFFIKKKIYLFIIYDTFKVSEMIIHEKLISFYKGFNYDAHPMVEKDFLKIMNE